MIIDSRCHFGKPPRFHCPLALSQSKGKYCKQATVRSIDRFAMLAVTYNSHSFETFRPSPIAPVTLSLILPVTLSLPKGEIS